eukprot:g21906.t1
MVFLKMLAEFLRSRRAAHVVVDEQRRALLSDASLKSMDFIVYSERHANLLVDVKGRRFPSGGDDGSHKWENWATADDLASLARWEAVFGEGFRSILVFAYDIRQSRWLAEVDAPFQYGDRPHYLAKAKRYWNPDFCPGDLFLDSADAHPVFYQTVGLLTTFLSLEQTAWVARVLAYALLAIGWMSCLSRLLKGTASPMLASWVFLALATFGNLSGEWIVGGVEAKVFSYAFVFWSLGMIFRGRWMSAAAFAGLAVSFHPVVGVWAVVCGLYAGGWILFRQPSVDGALETPRALSSAERNRRLASAAAVGLLCALPGLIPALWLVLGNPHPDADVANRIQVLERLAHHLDPTRFKSFEAGGYHIFAAWIGYAGLFVFWLSARRRGLGANGSTPAQRWFFHFVVMTVVIALAGVLVGWLPRDASGSPETQSPLFDLRVTLMKFYPFRVCDVFVPLAAAIALTRLLELAGTAEPGSRVRLMVVNAGLFGGFLLYALLMPIPDRNPSHMTAQQRDDWIAVCRWIRENTPADAQFLTPESSWAFKWYAQRAEYHSHKDCPQDTVRILEWRRRLHFLNAWDEKYPEAFTNEALRELMREEGITHLVCGADLEPLFDIAPIYPPPGDTETDSRYLVYRLSDAAR